MPSALVGLVAFSFTLLFFGSAVYTAALPSMVTRAQQDAELTPEQVQAAVTAAQTSLGESPQGAPETSDSKGAASTASGGAGSAGLGGLSGFSGLSGGTPLSPSKDPRTTQLTPAAQATTSAATTAGAITPKPSTPVTPSQPQTSEPDTPSPSDPEGPNAEAEQATHDILVSYANKLQGYTSEVQACVASFEADALTQGIERRAADQRVVNSLSTRIFGDFETLMNKVSVPEGSKWTDARDNLIGAYRTLGEYLDCYDTAWTLNLAFDDPAAHVDEFMGPINTDAPARLAEFNDYCSKVAL